MPSAFLNKIILLTGETSKTPNGIMREFLKMLTKGLTGRRLSPDIAVLKDGFLKKKKKKKKKQTKKKTSNKTG